MSQISQVLSIAKGEIGYRAERAPGERPSGHQKYSPQVPGLEWSQYQPWCAVWVSWVALKAGVSGLYPRTASVWAAMNWFRERGRWSEYPAVGAQVIYGTSGSTHTGICYAYDRDYIYTYEGNTSTTNDANGNGVMARKRLRRDSYVHGYGYPQFTDGIVTADPSKKGRDGFTYSITASGPSAGGGTGQGKYRVKRGQTLGAIAALLGVSLAALLAANPQIKDPNLVHPDQEINVPAKPAAPASPAQPAAPPEKPQPKPVPAPSVSSTHTVAKGDSLSSIAEAAGTTLSQLLSWNPGLAGNPNLIYPGQQIKVRPGKHAAPAPHVGVTAARKESKPYVHARPASRPAPPPVRPATRDDRLARIERELREVKDKLDDLSNKVDKLKPEPKPTAKPKPDSEDKAKHREPSVPPHHERPTPMPDAGTSQPTPK
ncbi:MULTISPECIES: LysM peptidoglycan-binding domain-containing protein [unclassified Streptomyces]|uniref:LysM peptidoglycan-binding domain-containing protein n=1 Tax=unclassified Streptomyces TaxID=2593676 RepID=UPI00200D8B03|nr:MULTISPECIES: LysM peptidoglycan-binding domain-containing protein [unclassified Streptomyces]MCM1967783.1 LysM peptidoglycan-binding domain-containing protein [Streptomyces sp. G1]UQI44622.1 LysM peptidoglycan-binding domain-containing protein [Streptomyces sp. HU2014]